jgi:hypothetical protein
MKAAPIPFLMNIRLTFALIAIAFAICSCNRNKDDPGIRAADTLAAHPADPTKPKQVPGVSDDGLRSPAAIDAAVSACVEAIKADPAEPRYRFELGRVLLLGGMPQEAREHLEAAAQKGHAGAYFYLGQMELNTAKAFFQKAADGKFAPSEKFVSKLKSVQTLQSDTEMSRWTLAGIIAATVVVLGGLVFIVWKVVRRRRRSLDAATAPTTN